METATAQEGRPAFFIEMSGRQFAGTVIVGLAAGILTWGLAFLLEQYVLKGMFCQTMMTAQCAAVPNYARGVAAVIATAAAVFALVKLQVFRPLLVALGAVISLWGVGATLTALPPGIVAALFAGMFAVAYTAFMWIARLRSFWIAAVLMVALIVAVRLLLTS